MKEPSSDKSSQYEYRILRAIRRIIRSVDIYSHKLLLEAGITVPQLSCLIRVVETGPMTLKTLAEEVNLSPSTLVGIVDRLQKKGLLHRERSGVDRREVVISASEEGRILALNSPPTLHDRLAAGLQKRPEEEQLSIALAIEKIVDLMEIQQVDAAPILHTGLTLRADAAADHEKREGSQVASARLRHS